MMKWVLFIPELYYVLFGLVFFILSLSKNASSKRLHGIAMTLAGVGVLVTVFCARQTGMVFFDAYRVDLFSQTFKLLLSLGTFWVISSCNELKGIDERQHPEFYFLISICTLGMMMLVSAVELLTIYVAIELSSYTLFLLVPMRRNADVYAETGIKYFMVGVTASAFMIFGISLIFGMAHTTYVTDILRVLPGVIHEPAAIAGLVLALCGFFFKQALFPFHSWAPDVYQGAANQVTTFIATASKMAAAAMVIRFVGFSGGESEVLVNVLMTLSILSMTFGNLVAIIQKDIKRLLAYSSIAHAGYMLVGILSMSERGFASAIYYALAYLVMNYAVFMVIMKIADDGHNLQIKELAGLHKRSPLLAMTLMMGLFGLAGIPPTVGFTGKFLVFAAALEKGYLALVVIGMVNATISLYYYLIVIKAAYLLEPVRPYPAIRIDAWTRSMSLALVGLSVYLGIFPDKFVALTEAAARSLPY
ncbi:NADH-quinone oxidoreductase subunit N [Desulforhabdus sp. TSK]|uniref:NADH-quinone oxidoreductase subunit N n=1 Tax=Desulforhabdus sp. TSK TaxID=2925014 RepID=UPI001FC7CE9A|nr:NADH-quinone oxidoreductase subunit N [Desulforhabdus sp. TSK]GKT08162.1 NADH-quinone oxidoreductase subunit N [Desulforhabdus sp. TSK]